MEKNKGITLATLVISVLVIIIIISITVVGLVKVIKESKLEDLKTNMMLIKANGKKCVDEFSFKTSKLNKNKEEDATKIEEYKSQILIGTPLDESPNEVKEAANAISGISDISLYYYLSSQDLSNMGLNVNLGNGEYYLIRYDIDNIDVEVINTIGYTENGTTYYTLTQIQDIEYTIGE